ncbi:MAG: hypothetical protein K0U16_07160 [Gammaproteobacteria bacterium]|nr:hypothetical protein [Gammaproteobacteria bacterium]
MSNERRKLVEDVLALPPQEAAEVISLLTDIANQHANRGTRLEMSGGADTRWSIVMNKYNDTIAHPSCEVVAKKLVQLLDGSY